MIAATLLAVSIVLGHLMPPGSMQHASHAIWYLARSFTFNEKRKTVHLGDKSVELPLQRSDLVVFPLISMASTLPVQCLLDYVWVPLVTHLAMGYRLSVWFTVANSALLCMYLSMRPEALLVLKSSVLWGIYNGDRKQWALRAAAGLHVCFMLGTLGSVGHWTTLAIGFLSAEAKYQMMHDPYSNMEYLSYIGSIGLSAGGPLAAWSLLPVISMPHTYDWHLRWKYTDKVRYSTDLLLLLSILVVATAVWYYN